MTFALQFAALSVLLGSPDVDATSMASVRARCGLEFLDAGAPSSACLTCHDPARPTGRRAPLIARHGHPYDVPYASHGRTRLRPVTVVERTLRLVDGRITCLTCHDPAATAPYRLASTEADILRGVRNLCVVCHDVEGPEDSPTTVLARR